jgi:hypothetical protein
MMMNDNPSEAEQLGINAKEMDAEIFNLGVSYQGINKMFSEGQEGLIASTENMIVNVDKAMQGLINTMGRGETFADGIRKNLSKAIPTVIELGGEITDAFRVNNEFTQILGKNITLNAEQTEQLFVSEQLTSLKTKDIVSNFADVGLSVKDISLNMIKVREVANNLGANAIAVTTEVVKNMQMLNRYNFRDGVEGLARMASQSQVLRVSMEKVFGLADEIMDPERAIELAGALQRLGASSQSLTDPLRLMDLAQNNVPQLQQELGKMFKQYTMFDEKTKSFKIMPGARLQLKAIADEMGIGIQEAERYALGAADIGKKLSEISFAGLDIDQDTKTLVANMATMGEGGEYTIKTESGEEVALQTFLEQYKGNEDELKKFLQVKEKEEGKTYEQEMLDAQKDIAELARMQLDAYKKAEKLGEAAAVALPASVAGSEFAQQVLAVNTQLAEKINRPIIENLGPNSPTIQAFDRAGKGLEDIVDEMKKENPDWDKVLTGFETTITTLTLDVSTSIGNVIKDMSQTIGPILKSVGVDVEAITKTIEDKITDILGGIDIESLKAKYPDLSESLLSGFEEAKNKAMGLAPSGEQAQALKDQISQAFQGLQSNLPNSLEDAKKMYDELVGKIPSELTPDLEKLKNVIDQMTGGQGAQGTQGGSNFQPPPPVQGTQGGSNFQLPPPPVQGTQGGSNFQPPPVPQGTQVGGSIQPPPVPNSTQQLGNGPTSGIIPLSSSINLSTIANTDNEKLNESITTLLSNQIANLQNSILQGNVATTNQNLPTELNLNDNTTTFNYDDIKNQLEQLNQNLISSQSLTSPQNLLVQQPTTPTVVTQIEQLMTDMPKLSEDVIENIRNQFSQTNTEQNTQILNNLTDSFTKQIEQLTTTNNDVTQSFTNLSQEMVNSQQDLTNNYETSQNLSNVNNKIGNTITEIPALQVPEIQSLISPSPAAINPLEIPKAENLMTNNSVIYGGEVKIAHEMEIKVSSTDGKLKGDELGKLLKDEIKRNNQLAGEISRAINGADLGALKKPGAISEPQFT